MIGASIPLTGGLAGFGYFEKWGYQHAVDQVNASGGIAIGGVRHKVKLIVLDDQTDPNTTVTNDQQLITQDHVTALLGSCTNTLVVADPWITLALAAARTSRIRLGVAAITPRLRHVTATAGALATLHAHAPGRVEAAIGSGFTAQLMLGQRPVPWAEVERYAVALRALLAGREIRWDGALTGLKHGARTGITPPGAAIPLYIAAHGPRGYGVAARAGDGIVTNLSHRGSHPLPPDMSQVQVLYYGTVLAPGEDYDDPRVLSAAGPSAAFQLHLGELGVAGDSAECAAFGQALGKVVQDRRHLELHQAHLIDLTELDRRFVTGELIARTTASGTPDQVRARLSATAAEGARGVLYGPMGDDIPRELEAFAAAATLPRSA